MEAKRTLINITKIGELLLKNGSEIYRVEESLERMGKAYGYEEIEVFAIPSYFTFSAIKNNEAFNLSKRSKNNMINIDKLINLNNLVRYISTNAPDNEYIEKEIKSIASVKESKFLVMLGYAMTAMFFTVFYGGTYIDSLAGLFIGIIVYLASNFLNKFLVNKIVATLVLSTILALIAVLFNKIGFVSNLDATIIGSLMVLVPGVAITNSLRDLMGGEFISGLARITEAILIAVSIAMGVAIILIML